MAMGHWTRREFLTRGMAAMGAAAVVGPGMVRQGVLAAGIREGGEDAPVNDRMNIVVVISDDQDFPSLGVMRHLNGMMGAESPVAGWTNFVNCGVAQGLCAPSRASFLTGRYPHEHGVTSNKDNWRLDAGRTLPVWLKAAGYRTALMGKYLFGSRKIKPIPPGWDVFDQGGRSDTLAPKAETYIRSVAGGGPFFLVVSTTDPHRPYRVPSRYKNAEIDLPYLGPADPDTSDRPEWVRKLRRRRKGRPEANVDGYRVVLAVDDLVKRVVDVLGEVGELENTAVVFMSDNGYSWGSNGIYGKNAPYEPSIHVPLAIFDPRAGVNRVCDRVVSAIDVTPTLVELAGATAAFPLSGRSLVPLLRGEDVEWDDAMLIQGHPSPHYGNGDWFGVRDERYTYVELSTGERELYDRLVDPWQNENVAGRPDYAEAQARLAERLAGLLGQ